MGLVVLPPVYPLVSLFHYLYQFIHASTASCLQVGSGEVSGMYCVHHFSSTRVVASSHIPRVSGDIRTPYITCPIQLPPPHPPQIQALRPWPQLLAHGCSGSPRSRIGVVLDPFANFSCHTCGSPFRIFSSHTRTWQFAPCSIHFAPLAPCELRIFDTLLHMTAHA